MRVIAIDYGDSRTGVAVSDRMGKLCGSAFVIHEKNRERLIGRIAAAVREYGAECVVVGHPLNMDGSKGPRAEKAAALRDALCARGINAVLWDERRTTVAAAAILHQNGRHGVKNREKVDAVAAALILEGYLGTIDNGQLTKDN